MKQIATEAEQLAKQAATEAGWKAGIVWPRVQMMSSQLEDSRGPLGRLVGEVTQVFDDTKQRQQVYVDQTEEEAVVVTPVIDQEMGLARGYPLLVLVLAMFLISATDYFLTIQRLPQFPHLFQYILVELLSLRMAIQTFVNLGLWMGMLTSLYFLCTHHLLASISLSTNLVLSLAYVALSFAISNAFLARDKPRWWTTVGIGVGFWMIQRELLSGHCNWLTAHTLNGSLVVILREIMYCLHNIKIWYQTVIRERRRLGPQLMSHPSHQQLALQATLQPTDNAMTAVQMVGDLYSNRICFLCLGGHCQRCLLSVGRQPKQETADVVSEKKGRSLEMWIASSVSHCPCRNIHGPGPSSFTHANHRPTGVVPPPGTLVSLTRYVRELKSRGLVKQLVNRVLVGTDAVGEALPLIFGRFTVPNDGQAPFLAKGQKVLKPTTPLSHAIVSRQSFRLTIQGLDGQQGAVQIGIGVTPSLVYRLLSIANASVCVPASLITHKGTAMDVDPRVDYVRVMVPKPDLVVRVNGERWHQIEFSQGLSGPLTIHGLDEGHYWIGVEICGIKSQDLHLLVRSRARESPEIPLAEQLEQLGRQRMGLQQRLKKLRKEAGKQAVDRRHEVEVGRRGWERQKTNVERLQKKRANLEMLVNKDVPQLKELPEKVPMVKVEEDGKERLRAAEAKLREVREKLGQLEREKEAWMQSVKDDMSRLDELKKINKMKS